MTRQKPLTERDLEVLNETVPMCSDQEPEWHRPLDVGGYNGSHHSPTLAKLEKRGLVESRQRSFLRGRRGSKQYRVTPEGIEVIETQVRKGRRPTVQEMQDFMRERHAQLKAGQTGRARHDVPN